MKNHLISAGALAALAFSTPAFAAANDATANATVNIVSPLTLENKTGLNFGTVVAPAAGFSGETVEVSTGGVRTCAAALICTAAASVSAAKFHVKDGTASQPLTVTVDNSATLTGSVSGSLTVDLTTDLPSGVVTDASGLADFFVGGTLTIPTSTVDGVYAGQFNVSVQYQ
jgi:Mat/Ecp fimbriae major subunit